VCVFDIFCIFGSSAGRFSIKVKKNFFERRENFFFISNIIIFIVNGTPTLYYIVCTYVYKVWLIKDIYLYMYIIRKVSESLEEFVTNLMMMVFFRAWNDFSIEFWFW
jgi:hypothetical protein